LYFPTAEIATGVTPIEQPSPASASRTFKNYKITGDAAQQHGHTVAGFRWGVHTMRDRSTEMDVLRGKLLTP
jgi:hypothetical protein